MSCALVTALVIALWGFMTRTLLLFFFVACASPNTPSDAAFDGGTDAPVDARGSDAPTTPDTGADAGDARTRPDSDTSRCPTPTVNQCCCRGDVVNEGPFCGDDGRWTCGEDWSFHTGFDCSWHCGAACGAFCSDEQICDPDSGYLEYIGRTCTETSDCTVGEHTTDCCGSRSLTGVRVSDRRAFDGLAATCTRFFGECDCPPDPTTADDGSTGEPADVIVECVERRCRTRF